MTSKAVLLALIAMWGVSTCAPGIALAQDGDAAVETDESEGMPEGLDSIIRFTDKVWVRADASPDLPGPMQVFLSDGTLVTDSCWETYRLSEWKMAGDNAVTWNEDGMDINAEIVSVTADELVLRLAIGEGQEQRYVSGEVPFICPDLPR